MWYIPIDPENTPARGDSLNSRGVVTPSIVSRDPVPLSSENHILYPNFIYTSSCGRFQAIG